MALLDPQILTLLRNRGYTGGDTIEDVVAVIHAYLSERGLAKINNISWWIIVKDEGMLKNKSFQQSIADKFIEYIA